MEKPIQSNEFYKVENALKYYQIPGQKTTFPAVSNVDITVRKGETYGLVGESGCGKTTLVRMMMGLVGADAGRFIVNGIPINWHHRADLQRLYKNVQMVFQDPYSSLNPRMRIYDLFKELYNFIYKKFDKDKFLGWIDDLLFKVGLDLSFLNRYPFQISGGQRQRVALARALSMEPEMLILDEAVSALDVSVQAQILDLLKELQKKLNLTYLFISHDLAVVNVMADRVGIMLKGLLVEEGDADKIFLQPSHPYSAALLKAAKEIVPQDEVVINRDWSLPDSENHCPFVHQCIFAIDKCSQTLPLMTGKNGSKIRCFSPLN